MSARFKNNYVGPAAKKAVELGTTANIRQLLERYGSKPSLPQLYKVWAQSRADFDAEVDRRLPEVRQQRGDPGYARIGLWNALASEGYHATSEEEKAQTLQKAKDILRQETDKWKDGLAEPRSMEEAAE